MLITAFGTKPSKPIRQACPLLAKAAVKQRILVLPTDPRELGGPSVSGNSVANVAWGSASLASPFVLPSLVLGLSDPSQDEGRTKHSGPDPANSKGMTNVGYRRIE